MDAHEWIGVLIAMIASGISGGFIYKEFLRRSERSYEARRFVDKSLDPFLKATDELAGKLAFLAREDFKSLEKAEADVARLDNDHFSSLVFLIAQFWGNIEMIRHEGLTMSINKDKRGRKLQDFMKCIESRKNRIVNRTSQRAIGELALASRADGSQGAILFTEFARLMKENDEARNWLSPLRKELAESQNPPQRQKLLKYGIILHAMIDSLDPDHQVTHSRPPYPHKLSKKSWMDLKYRVFGQYLKSVANPEKYLGPPKKQRHSNRERERPAEASRTPLGLT